MVGQLFMGQLSYSHDLLKMLTNVITNAVHWWFGDIITIKVFWMEVFQIVSEPEQNSFNHNR